jgi:hypothetical protein
MGSEGEAILVAARLRPQLSGDDGIKQCLSVSGSNQVLVSAPRESDKHAFTFDYAWGGDVSQAEVFAHAAPLVDSVLDGFNATIFAHGPSGDESPCHPVAVLEPIQALNH